MHNPAEQYPPKTAQPYDYEAILPLELIREHTKTDDVPSVTDAQLTLYRRAALQAAARYTGLLLDARKTVTEEVEPPAVYRPSGYGYGGGYGYGHHGGTPEGTYFMYELRHPVAEPTVYYYGLQSSRTPEVVGVEVGSRIVRLPRRHNSFGLGCCNPCSDGAGTARVMYVAGYGCLSEVDASVSLGALKYIAHVIENPGDQVVLTTAGGRTQSTGLTVTDSSNPALASGAIEIWRAAVGDAI